MVVDDVQDFDVGVVGQQHVGGVLLPAFVREIGHEADVGALGSFVRLGVHETSAYEHPPDR